MENIIIFGILFILVYLAYEIFIIHNKKALSKIKEGKELFFLKRNYKLDYEKLNMKKVVRVIALTNAFILSFTTTLVCLINDWVKNFYLWLIICLVMAIFILIPLILIIYNLIGKYLKKQQK